MGAAELYVESVRCDMDYKRMKEDIWEVINQWDGTAYGYQLKNSYENGTDLETICEMAGLDYDSYTY